MILCDPGLNIIDSFHILVPNQKNHSWARTEDGIGEWAVSISPTSNNVNGATYTAYAAQPNISPLAGFYSGNVEVSINSPETGVTIYYTTDGSEPSDADMVYTGPFLVSASTVVRTVAYPDDPNMLKSHEDYHTFFIDEEHVLPVVSISGQQVDNLINGSQWLSPEGTFELFDETGDRVADATGEFNKHGNDSWAYPQRGIDFISRDQFGDDFAVKYAVFDENITDRDQFQRLILKAAANDNYPFEDGGAHIRDAYVHTLAQRAGMELDARTNRSCVIYVNGEYWGVYEMREKVDDHDYTEYYYGQNRQNIDFIKTWGGTWAEYGTTTEWNDLVDFVLANDMTDAANYAYVEGELNMLSLIDYMILHAHIVSMDWLNWNTAWWRGYHPDGGAKKWRYILWDEDATFGHYINYTGVPDTGPLADPCNPELLNDPGGQGHIPVLNALLENEDFFALYINRYADLNNQYFNCEFMLPLLLEMTGTIEPEMERHIDRWGGTIDEWHENIQTMYDFIEERCVVIDTAIVDCYEDEGLSGPFNVTILVEPPASGFVQANTTIGNNYPWLTTYFGGIGVSFTNVPEEDWLFSHWEVQNNDYLPDQFADMISMTIDTTDVIIAHFEPGPCLGVWVDPELPENMTICQGSTLTLEAASGPGFTYEWSTGQTSQSIVIDNPGNYSVTVYNSVGCDGYVEIDVDETNFLSPQINGPASFCTGFNATLDAGPGYDTYQWSNGATTQTIDVVSPGVYNVLVTDASGCSGIAELEVTETADLPVTIEGELEICDGTSTLLNAGPGYTTYTWSDGSENQTLSINTGGSYTVTVSDPSGCTGVDEVFVDATPLSTTNESAQICYGGQYEGNTYFQSTTLEMVYGGFNGCDSIHVVNLNVLPEVVIDLISEDDCASGGASIVAIPVGGTGTYNYLWDNGAITQEIEMLPQGTYSVTVSDDFGCTGTSSIDVDPLEGVSVDYDVDPVSCFGDSNGEIDLAILTGTPPYQFIWSNGETTEDLSDLSPGDYTVIITDANDCNLALTIEVGQPAPFVANISTTPVSSSGANDGTATVTPTGGTPPFTYNWEEGNFTPTLTGVGVGSYPVTITDANGCTAEGVAEISLFSDIEEVDGLLRFDLRPNPSAGRFFVDMAFNQLQTVALDIYNVTGQLIQSYSQQSGQNIRVAVDISHSPDGAYLLVARFGNGQQLVQKVLVAR